MLVRVQVRANMITLTPHQYVYVYMCMYMSHISVALITDFIAAPAQENHCSPVCCVNSWGC